MERKLVAIDLDGTTLNNDSILTPETERTIRQITEQGHIVSIATGRPYRTSLQYYHQLELNTPIVNFNGAWCHHPNDRHWKNGYHRHLDREVALSFLPLKRFPVVRLLAAESKNMVYVDRPGEETYSNGPSIQNFKTEAFTADSLQENPTSVNVFTTDENTIPFLQDRIIDRYGDNIEVRTWGGPTPSLEIVAAGIQKAMGLEKIAEYYNISRENIIAFGDEANDYEMIQFAGHGVVMKNGIDGLKKIANDITSYSNHEHGLSKYLNKYFELS